MGSAQSPQQNLLPEAASGNWTDTSSSDLTTSCFPTSTHGRPGDTQPLSIGHEGYAAGRVLVGPHMQVQG